MTTTPPTESAPTTANGRVTSTAKSLEAWIWDAACSIRGAKDAPKYKDFILPLVFAKRLCDVFDDELDRIAAEVGSRAKAFAVVKHDKKLVRFYLPLEPATPDEPVWSVIRLLSSQIGEALTTHLRAIADANPLLKGIIDRVDFNATTHGQRDIDDDRLSNLVEAISEKPLGLDDVEPDIIGRTYEYLIRKFAEGSGQSAGEFYTLWGAKTRLRVGSGRFGVDELVVSLALSTMGGAGAGVVLVRDVRAGDGARDAVFSLV
jgi:type I restriction enzyme M protein